MDNYGCTLVTAQPIMERKAIASIQGAHRSSAIDCQEQKVSSSSLVAGSLSCHSIPAKRRYYL